MSRPLFFCVVRCRAHGSIYSATEYAGRKGSEPGTKRMTDPKGGFFTLLTESATGGKYTGPVHWDVRLFRYCRIAVC